MMNAHKTLRITVRALCLFLCLALAVLLSAPAAGAAEGKPTVDPVNKSESYSAVIYNNTNGLPTSESNAIAQTAEGFVWIGSYSGLIRYDGSSFERMDSTTGVSSVVCLLVDSGDRLWIGTNDNGLALMERGEFRMWGEDEGLGSTKICAIAEDADGNICVGTTAGITIVSPDFTLRSPGDPRIAGAYMEDMKTGSDGLLHCITNSGDYFTLKDGELVDYIGHSEMDGHEITGILPDPDDPGKLYIGTGDSDLYHGDLKRGIDSMEHVDISPLFNVMDIDHIGDQIWICARNGIGVVDGRGFHHLSDLPMNNSVDHVMMDYEGNLWFTSSRQGVMKLVSNRFADVFARFGLPERVVNSTCMYNGELYVATDTGLMILDGNGPVSSVPLTSAKTASGEDLGADDLLELLNGCRIRSIVSDSQGRLWISTWQAHGLLRYDRGEITAFTAADGLLSEHVRIACETPDGAMLIACTGGVNVIEGDRVTAAYGTGDGIANPESLSVVSAPNGDIVLGSNGGGIYVINKDGVRCVGKNDGLSSGIIMRIKYDEARDLYWLVTSNSLAYMTSDYRVTTVSNFPFSNNFDMYENSRGDMWILSGDGIYVLPADELIENGRMSPLHYGMANGLPCIATSNSYSALTDDGDLYIAGSSGVAKVNIEEDPEKVGDIRQSVPYVDADDVRIYPDETGGFTIPSNVRKLTIHGHVYSYSLTDPQVSYYLDGFDREAATVSRSELGPVSYTNLPGGSYRFVMELKDALGQESKTLSVPIVKEKAFYELAWVHILAGLAAALIIALLVRSYVRRKMRALEEKHREEKERERIENELTMANKIQSSMLPHLFPPFPDRKEFDLYASMDPAKEVGGDFYDFFLVDDDHLCLVMADVSGKGVPAALFMMVSKVILQSYGNMGQSAAEILTKTNEAICSNNQAEMFVTVWLGILEISTGKLTAANAGHEYPVLRKPGGGFELVKDKHGLVIGGMEGVRYREYELQMEPGSKLFLYTDGVPEATDADNNMFGADRMVAALNTDPEAAPEQILKNVRAAVDAFVKDAEQFDDLTMLCLEYHG